MKISLSLGIWVQRPITWYRVYIVIRGKYLWTPIVTTGRRPSPPL